LRVSLIVATAIVLILQVLAALAMIVISVHGPEGLGIAAIVYLVVALGVTSWVAARHRLAELYGGVIAEELKPCE